MRHSLDTEDGRQLTLWGSCASSEAREEPRFSLYTSRRHRSSAAGHTHAALQMPPLLSCGFAQKRKASNIITIFIIKTPMKSSTAVSWEHLLSSPMATQGHAHPVLTIMCPSERTRKYPSQNHMDLYFWRERWTLPAFPTKRTATFRGVEHRADCVLKKHYLKESKGWSLLEDLSQLPWLLQQTSKQLPLLRRERKVQHTV